jgi:hypothetical protein
MDDDGAMVAGVSFLVVPKSWAGCGSARIGDIQRMKKPTYDDQD